MSTTNIQIIASEELTLMVDTIREIIRAENNLNAKAIITNGYVLNTSVRYLKYKNIDFNNVSYWEKINKLNNIRDLLTISINKSGETMKFRLASLSNDVINNLTKNLSEIYGTRIRKNFIVKLILKAYLIERENEKKI